MGNEHINAGQPVRRKRRISAGGRIEWHNASMLGIRAGRDRRSTDGRNKK